MLNVIRKMFDLLTARERWQGLVLLASMMLVAVVETAGIASIMPFMAVVADPDIVHTNRWLNASYVRLGFSSDTAFLRFLGTAVVCILVLSNAIKSANSWLTLRYTNKLHYVLSKRLLARYMTRPYRFYLNRNTAELAKNILSESRSVVIGIASPLIDLVSRGLVALAIMVLLLFVDPLVAAAIGSVLGGLYGVIYVVARRRLNSIGIQQVDASAEKFKAANEALSGIKELKVLGREPAFIRRFSKHAECHARNNVIAGLIGELPRHALEVIAFGGILAMVLYLLGHGNGQGALIPMLAVYAFAGYRLLPALQQLFAAAALLRRSVAALELLHADLSPEPGETVPPEQRMAENARVPSVTFTDTIELRNVEFSYEGAPVSAVRGIDLTIKANSTVGLVGPTGCGKTTLVDIILGLLQPDRGELLVDGAMITADILPGWQRNLGYVPQQIYITDDTVARNIAFGDADAEIDMAAVRRAARMARLDEFVEEDLPKGYETLVGERGVRLSGGQRQRIGIARALYRDPAVLVMDEATSALDGLTEESVMEAVRSLSSSKTIILIAHRLTTVRACDLIFLMENGSITFRGNYDQLKQQSSWFRAASGDSTASPMQT